MGLPARFLPVLVLAAMLPACAFTASPERGLRAFNPPAGWKPSPGILGFMQFWRSPYDDREVLLLFKSPKALTADEIFSNADLRQTTRGVTVRQRRQIEICGDQPATYFEGVGESKAGGRENVQMVLTDARGTSYFAIYVRPLTTPANAAAQAALRELCAKP